jgi:SAM-dependent methyltransferase
LGRSEVPADHYWGSRPIDLRSRDLPRLKAEYLVDATPPTGRVLEIGCGGGRLLQTLAVHRPGVELHGVDIRPLRVVPSGFEFRLVDPSAPDLPYDDAAFDTVVMFDFLEHVDDPAAHLAAARRVLRSSGELVSFTPLEGNPCSVYRLYRRWLGDDLYVETKDHRQAFSERDLDGLVGEQFEIVDRRYLYHALGQLMDATLFALLRLPVVRRRYVEDHPYYQDDAEPGSGALAALMRLGNWLAYSESRVLRARSWGSTGLLFRARAKA